MLNQFTGTGLLLIIAGGFVAEFRTVPVVIWKWIVKQTTTTITVVDTDPAFNWTKEWMLGQEFTKKLRRVDLDSTIRGRLLSLLPAPGDHLFWRHGRPFWLIFRRSDEKRGGRWSRDESFEFQTIGRNPAVLTQFVRELLEAQLEGAKQEAGLYVWHDYWCKNKSYSGRSIEGVILQDNQLERLVNDATQFLSSEERYRALGIPYHRGYLFYGPPGTGKTSLASGLAKRLGMSIYLIHLAEHNDKTLKMAMVSVPVNSMVLFEDIDVASGVSKKRSDAPDSLKDAMGVSLSGLLNVLDGLSAPNSVIFVMTTNHIDSIDPALLRPGRIDYRLYMGEATESQRVAMYRRFFPDEHPAEAQVFVRARPENETMAEFQGLLLLLTKTSEAKNG
jgi:chaperone BCS1